MLRLAVLVSGGGTNLQAILDAIDEGIITNAEVSVVISNNAGAYALERAKKKEIDAVCLSPKTFASREAFNEALLAKLQSYNVDLVVLAGCLVVIPQSIVDAYPNKIIFLLSITVLFTFRAQNKLLGSLIFSQIPVDFKTRF